MTSFLISKSERGAYHLVPMCRNRFMQGTLFPKHVKIFGTWVTLFCGDGATVRPTTRFAGFHLYLLQVLWWCSRDCL